MNPPFDAAIAGFDRALRAVFVTPRARRPTPGAGVPADTLTPDQRRHAAALMRVNHVGEVCAQALYASQAAVTRDAGLRAGFERAAAEETDHLAWTAQRLVELDARPSLLNPVWYAGAYAIGLAAGRAGDATSLGFVVETERQVEQHLASHLERLPADDHRSRAIVDAMRQDEAAHAEQALRDGARPLPAPLRWTMRQAARLMTTTAYWI